MAKQLKKEKKQAWEIVGSIPGVIRDKQGLYLGDLTHYYWVLWHHATNLRGPYHDYQHMTGVAFRCYDALKFYARFYPGLISQLQARLLMIAALLHDANHTMSAFNADGEKITDQVNIDRAIAFLREHVLEQDRSYQAQIEGLIDSATFFPPRVVPAELSLLGGILRDADTSQALNRDWIQKIIFGLGAELLFNELEMLHMQESFLGGLVFCTEWAHRRFPRKQILKKIREANDLLALAELRPITV